MQPHDTITHPSKERVVRHDQLVYAEGAPIPDTDIDELERQGYLDKKEAAAARKGEPANEEK